MNKINYTKVLAAVTASMFFVPFFIFAAGPGSSGAVIQNPLGTNDVKVLLTKVMNLVSAVGGMVVVFFVIFSGYKFVTARGNQSELTKAKEIFYATIIGGAILLGAGIIANVVVNTIYTTLH